MSLGLMERVKSLLTRRNFTLRESRPRADVEQQLNEARKAHVAALKARDKAILAEFQRIERGPSWKKS